MIRKSRGRFAVLTLLPLALFALLWKLQFANLQGQVWLKQQSQSTIKISIVATPNVPIYHGEKTCYASTKDTQEIQSLLNLLQCRGALSGQQEIPPAYGLTEYGTFFEITLFQPRGKTEHLTLCASSGHNHDLIHYGSSSQQEFLGVAHVSLASYKAFSDAFDLLWDRTGRRSS